MYMSIVRIKVMDGIPVVLVIRFNISCLVFDENTYFKYILEVKVFPNSTSFLLDKFTVDIY